jgi:hypothetical protein
MGKLNILHHKEWHVYKRENRERVLKDEQEEAQKLEKKEEIRKRDERNSRISKLAQDKKEFTLFPQESTSVVDKKKEKEKELWYLQKEKEKEPWYLKKNNNNSTNSKNNLEKKRQDPLLKFKVEHSEEKIISKSKKNTLTEMRRKRLEREKEEALKTSRILGTGASGTVEEYKKHERDQGYYHSQFNREFKK